MVFFLRIVVMSLRSLMVHPLRTFLATMGVIIGVGAVVSAMSILEGFRAQFADQFETIGANKLFVSPGVQRSRGRALGAVDTLELEDCEAIRQLCPSVKNATPQVNSVGLVKFLSKNTQASILGADESYDELNNYHAVEGAFVAKSDVLAQNSVAVLGHKIKKELFGQLPAVGQSIKISTGTSARSFRVIGVMEEKGNLGFTDADKQIVVPISTAMNKLYGLKSVSVIMVEAVSASEEDLEAAKSEIKKVLRARHRIRAGQDDDFNVQAQREILEQFESFRQIIAVVLISISSISIAVGGIGIMNIMLVAVTERTREIGVRMAMGAQRSDVLTQFVIEAGFVSFLGGALGVGLGVGLAAVLEKLTRVLEPQTSTSAVVIALVMATVTGLVSGIYPAYKASRLDPIEALRYE